MLRSTPLLEPSLGNTAAYSPHHHHIRLLLLPPSFLIVVDFPYFPQPTSPMGRRPHLHPSSRWRKFLLSIRTHLTSSPHFFLPHLLPVLPVAMRLVDCSTSLPPLPCLFLTSFPTSPNPRHPPLHPSSFSHQHTAFLLSFRLPSSSSSSPLPYSCG